MAHIEPDAIDGASPVRNALADGRFMLDFSDALRALSDPLEIEAAVCRMLGEATGVNRVVYGEVEDERIVVLNRNYLDGVGPTLGRFDSVLFGRVMLEAFKKRSIIVFADVRSDPRLGKAEVQRYQAVDITALLSVGLVKDGRWVAVLGLHSAAPRKWTPADVALVEEAIRRAWAEVERARAEIRLRESEKRQGLLLTLSDELRTMTDPVAMQKCALTLLSGNLGASRASYQEVEGDGELLKLTVGHEAGLVRLPSRVQLSDYGPNIASDFLAGKTFVVRDSESDPRLVAERAAHRDIGVRAWIGVPCMREGRLTAIVGLQHTAARDWSDVEVGLVQEVALRTQMEIQRARADASLRESEEKYRTLFGAMDEGFAIVEVVGDGHMAPVDLITREANPAMERFIDLKSSEFLNRPISGVATEDVVRRWIVACGEVAMTGKPAYLEHLGVHGWWYGVHISPYRRNIVVVIFENITERKRAELAARESERRQAFLLNLSDSLRPLSKPLEAQRMALGLLGQYLDVVRAVLFEVAEDDDSFVLIAKYEDNAVPLESRMRLSNFPAHLAEGFRAGRTQTFRDTELDAELEFQREAHRAIGVRAWAASPLIKDGRVVAILGVHSRTPRIWTRVEIEILEDVAERMWAALERARADEHRIVLMEELNHRVKNTLAVVQSISHQTLKGGGSVANASELFDGRLFALSKAHALLTRNVWAGAPLRELAVEIVRASGAPAGRFHAEGPNIDLGQKQTLSMAMALHELAVNAIAYGAWSNADGVVTLTWMESGGSCHITWRESGGPQVSVPARRGYGSRMVEEALSYDLGGAANLAFDPDGLIAHIEIPLAGNA